MLVSVVIPCFNSSATIQRCVDSVFNQQYKQLEIICIDDGSSDNTVEILESLKLNSNFPFTIIQQQNSGACAARNKGLNIANGDYVQFLDSDDALNENKIEHQVNLLSKNQTDIILSSYEKYFLNGKNKIVDVHENDFWEALTIGKAGITSSNLFKKSILREVGGWDETMKSSQEAELMFRIFQHTKSVLFDSISNTKIFEQKESISTRNRLQNWKRYILLRIDILKYLEQNNLLTDGRKDALHKNIFDSIRILYSFNKDESIIFYNSYVKSKIIPESSSATSKLYIRLFKIFGFKLTQKAYSLLK